MRTKGSVPYSHQTLAEKNTTRNTLQYRNPISFQQTVHWIQLSVWHCYPSPPQQYLRSHKLCARLWETKAIMFVFIHCHFSTVRVKVPARPLRVFTPSRPPNQLHWARIARALLWVWLANVAHKQLNNAESATSAWSPWQASGSVKGMICLLYFTSCIMQVASSCPCCSKSNSLWDEDGSGLPTE